MEFIDLKAQQKLIRKNIEKRIHTVLDHGQYIMGPEVAELENKLIDFTGAKYCISCSSGTDALLIALMALGVGHGDEIITTPFSFFATGEVATLLGAKLVFIDIDPNTYNIDSSQIEAKISKHTKAIIPVSLYGLCSEMDHINSISLKYNIPIIEDAAQSFGATYKGKQSCNLSTIGCTSFFPSKPLGGYGDSGACFTNDENLAKKMKEIRLHGQERRYHHTSIGINGRIDTLQAAIILAKLEIFNKEVELRNEIGQKYLKLLSGEFKTQFTPSYQTNVYAQFTVEVDNRDQVQSRLNEQKIPTAVHYPVSIHMQPVYSNLGYKEGDYPKSEYASKHVMSLPMHPYLSENDQKKVVESLKLAASDKSILI